MAVAAGILASRLMGLVRQKVFAFHLGAGDAADAFNLALRIPNMLQNLFGEGVLSASFIPVYARLRASGADVRRREVAGAVLGILAAAVSILVLLGVFAAPVIVTLLTPGFGGAQRELTIQLVRILFPGSGLLVLSAWCLGVLNAHGRFLLSYASPVIWNAAIIAALLGWGGREGAERLVWITAWGSTIGSALQLAVQWPAVLTVLGGLAVSLRARAEETRRVFRNFWPAFIGRGVTQLSAFLDVVVASFLVEGSATMLANAQAVYMLPVSLFGMSVSASALPELSSEALDDAGRGRMRERLDRSLRQVAFLVIPSTVAFLLLGDAIVGLLFEGGAFGARESEWQVLTLAAAGVGLVGATLGRLYSTTLFALQDARTPQRTAVSRVTLAALLGLGGALVVVPRAGLDPTLGIVALVLASALAAWVEWGLLRRAVAGRIGKGAPAASLVMRMWLAAAVSGAAVAVIARTLPMPAGSHLQAFALRVAALAAFGLGYLAMARALGIPQVGALLERVRR